MTDSHETNHAVGPGSRHADGVRSSGLSNEQDLRKWALQTILLSPHPMPSSWADLERGASRLIAFVETGSSVLPEFVSRQNTSFFSRGVEAGNKDVSSFKGAKILDCVSSSSEMRRSSSSVVGFIRDRLHFLV
ncbi:hypothetical protein FKW31_10030 [Acetobacter sp. DmW_136]|uniref:hypothetical protein n=1 Tax=Acetobacter sp. DmW_136 TaxID=2591091 RepID=UPI00123AC760|nr:hypothetical protein [Acetobacter sp. DmW_136]KAA8385140.1 hypothetical protein FKW31_10030 [Acetobacter sp. DmW_136]